MIHKCFEGNTTQDEKPSYHKKNFEKNSRSTIKGLAVVPYRKWKLFMGTSW